MFIIIIIIIVLSSSCHATRTDLESNINRINLRINLKTNKKIKEAKLERKTMVWIFQVTNKGNCS